MNYKELLFKTSDLDKVYRYTNSIVVELSRIKSTVSNSQLNGAYNENIKYIFNNQLSKEDISYLESNNNIKKYLIKKSNELDLDCNESVGLITSADMKNYGFSIKKYKDLEVVSIVTAGVRVNASRSGDSASFYEEKNFFYQVGTINIIILINANLTNDALISSLTTAVEAKSVALYNLRIPSQFSNGFATGTGTDGIVISSNKNSLNKLTNAGKHSKLGELIGKSVIEAINIALKKEVWITPTSQCNVLIRLNRFKIDINEFYDELNLKGKEKEEFIKKLSIDSKN